jgi:hypothetical protein
MRLISTLLLFIFTSCAQHRISPSEADRNVATDSLANGKIQGTAIRKIKGQQLCFDVTLKLQDVEQEIAEAANWTLAWMDAQNRYYLLSLQLRTPASSPKGGTNLWTNTFQICEPKKSLESLDSLLLTPKTLPFKETDGLRFQWN